MSNFVHKYIVMPHADATNPTANRYKYGAKELATDLGLNAYDFEARMQTPALPMFAQIDPLAEKYYSLSPYLYCACNPINLIDPTGMKFDTSNLSDEELIKYQELINDYCSQSELFKALYDYLDNHEEVFNISFGALSNSDGTSKPGEYNSESKTITINVGNDYSGLIYSVIGEEMFHVYQSENTNLYENEQINMEFEAKTFTALTSPGLCGGINDETIGTFWGGISKDVFETNYIQNLPYNTSFDRDYREAAQAFVRYYQNNANVNILYKQPNLSGPVGIYHLINVYLNK